MDTVQEGQFLYKFHKYRERNKKITAQRKAIVSKSLGKLACEVCNFEFEPTYRELGAGYIECHHVKPLSETEEFAETKLEDLALVCSSILKTLILRCSTVKA